MGTRSSGTRMDPMVTQPPDLETSQRVLIFALFGADGSLTGRILESNGVASCVCPNLDTLCAAIAEGAAAIIVSEEALIPSATRRLTDLLDAQPPWSDLPILISASEREPILEGRGALGAI